MEDGFFTSQGGRGRPSFWFLGAAAGREIWGQSRKLLGGEYLGTSVALIQKLTVNVVLLRSNIVQDLNITTKDRMG